MISGRPVSYKREKTTVLSALPSAIFVSTSRSYRHKKTTVFANTSRSYRHKKYCFVYTSRSYRHKKTTVLSAKGTRQALFCHLFPQLPAQEKHCLISSSLSYRRMKSTVLSTLLQLQAQENYCVVSTFLSAGKVVFFSTSRSYRYKKSTV